MEQVTSTLEPSPGNGVDAASAERPLPPAPATPELDCRPLALRDVPSLLGDFEFERYHLPDSLVAGRGLIRSSLGSLRPLLRGQPRTFVAIDQGRIAAFVQFQPAGRDRRWVAMGAGYLSSPYAPGDAVEAVLRFAVEAAGERGVKRLYARLPEDADFAETYQRVGFRPYADETVWVAERRSGKHPAATLALREQEMTDTWAVHQLYNASVPRDVQYAEAATSHRWELSHDGRRGSAVRGFLLEDGFMLTAYARVLSCDERHHLEVMFNPEASVDRGAFLRAVLARIDPQTRARQVYVAVRSYQQEVQPALETLGFLPRVRQRCTIRYTAARVRQAEGQSVSAVHAEVRERLPKQVPTFVKRRPPGRNPVV